LHVLLWGYDGSIPAEVDIVLGHRDEIIIKPMISPMKNNNSMPRVWGSPEIWNVLINPNDKRLSNFRLPALHIPVEKLSLSDAAKIGEYYIRACESDEGRSIDCYMAPLIGGNIHTAVVTSNDGFCWLRPPI
jgi:hypothetical protein